MGLAKRAAQLADLIAEIRQVPDSPRQRVANGAVVRMIDDAENERLLLVMPGGTGERLSFHHETVVVVSPSAPILRDVFGKAEGDVGVIHQGATRVDIEIVEIR